MIAEVVVAVGVIYAALGLLFAVAFVVVGIGQVDSAARSSSWIFRMLALPASTALWPLLAWRWARGEGPPDERGPHRKEGA